MATKWDDGDDVERPVVRTKPDAKALLDWQGKVNAAASAAAAPKPASAASASPDEPASPTSTARWVLEPALTEPVEALSPAQIASLRAEARDSARYVNGRAANGRVRLRTHVDGWYEGSVPAVEIGGGRHGVGYFFPPAPTIACADAQQYLVYWRAPFVAELRALGLEVVEDDLSGKPIADEE